MKRPHSVSCFLLMVFWTISQATLSALNLPPVFSDHMVLQRDSIVRVWGTDLPGTKVTVTFGQQAVNTVTEDSGKWMAELQPMETSAEPREMTIRGSRSIVFQDVLVGDVWLCSGQSNMEKPLGEKKGQRPTEDYQAALATADDPLIRLFQVPRYGRVKNEASELRWLPCSAESLEATAFSAAGYYFARTLREHRDTPVGIIHSSFGGSMIEAWIPPKYLQSDPVLKSQLHRQYFAWVEGVQVTELYQSMIQHLVPYSLKGFLWYQGEANVMYAEGAVYTRKLQALIHSWRNLWQRPQAPFLFVQLAPFNYSEWDKFARQLTAEALPLFREAQTATLAVPGTDMVVTTDLAGSARDIHPTRKREVGQRLAWLALNIDGAGESFGKSPRYRRSRILDGAILVEFMDAPGGLKTRDGQSATGFTISGPDKIFHPATVAIDGDSIRLSSPNVANPVAVRFAWHETANPNLVSMKGLPVAPFRTDNWEIQNEK
ncbi:MAG: sialate O-acetylesterase [Puniceicoccaceae bacterium]